MAQRRRPLRGRAFLLLAWFALAACTITTEPIPADQPVGGERNELETRLVGTVWLVEWIEEPSIFGPLASPPSLTFTTGSPLNLTVIDECGAARISLGLPTISTYPVVGADGLSLLCPSRVANYFRSADVVRIVLDDRLKLESEGVLLVAGHVVSVSDPSETTCIDVSPSVQLLDEIGRFIADCIEPSALWTSGSTRPEDRQILLDVEGRACPSTDETLRGPQVVETEDRVFVAIGHVRGGTDSCAPGSSVDRQMISLDVPLGERVLWNAGLDEAIQVSPR